MQCWLNENFDDSVVLLSSGHFGYGWSWPPYSPDLNPYADFLRGALKDTVHKNNPHTIKLQQEILATVIISEETLAAFTQNFQHRLQVLDFCGAHTENFFIYQSPKTT
jgi:hypothetical protein